MALNSQRMERNGWSFVGSEEEQTSLRPSMASFRRIAERNQAKARLRYLRARRMASKDDDEEVWGEDSFLDEPSADESLPPDHSDFQLTLSSALSLPLASTDPRLTFSSLKRSGDTLESESVKSGEKSKGYVAAPRNPRRQVNLADFGIRAVDEDALRLALVPEDIQNAIDLPTARWPTYQTLYGRDPPIPRFYG